MLLGIDNLSPGSLQLTIRKEVRSAAGFAMDADYVTSFHAVTDTSALIDLNLRQTRFNRASGRVTFNAQAVNRSPYDLSQPLILAIDPLAGNTVAPANFIQQSADGRSYVSFGGSGVLPSQQVTSSQPVSIRFTRISDCVMNSRPKAYRLPTLRRTSHRCRSWQRSSGNTISMPQWRTMATVRVRRVHMCCKVDLPG